MQPEQRRLLMEKLLKKSGLHYAWVIAAITFVVLFVAAGVRSTPSILLVPLHEEFGWSTATISAALRNSSSEILSGGISTIVSKIGRVRSLRFRASRVRSYD